MKEKLMKNNATSQCSAGIGHDIVDPVAGFGTLIETEGYGHNSQLQYSATARTFWSAMIAANLKPIDLSDDQMEQLATHVINDVSAKDRQHCRYRLDRFRDYLIQNVNAPARSVPKLDMSPRACLKREYDTYLRIQRGLSADTIYHCLRFFDRFLTSKFGDGLGDLDAISPNDVTGFILEMRKAKNAPRDKTVPSHLRNLFKFLFWSNRTQRDLSRSIPRTRQPKPTSIPRYLEPAQVNRLIEVVRGHKKTGRRNHAMLMLIARLGLRAPEVTAIELEDIDWRSGEILIRGKGKLHDRMPLPAEVGEAIVDYIQNERRGPERALFVSVKPPFKRFKSTEILRWILKNAYDATGISPPQSYIGTHILRHSLATDMLRKGASFADIGDVLRHRSPLTTTIYAQHDVDALRSISRSWPTVEGAK
jgi:integrase/recombinase XerD